MKRALFMTLCLFIATIAMAQKDEKTYFTVKGLATPVTVETSQGTYKVYSQLALDGLVEPTHATDANGNWVVIPGSSYKSGTNYHYRYYEFSTLYRSNSSTTDNSTDNTTSTVTSNSNSVGEHLAHAASVLSALDAEGYPNVSVKVGWSRIWGEFVRAKACLGGYGGFVFYGGIGKKLWGDKGESIYVPETTTRWATIPAHYVSSGKEYQGRTTWHVGIGYYLIPDEDEASDICLGVSLGKPVVCNSMIINMDLTYTYYFGNSQRFGAFAGASLGVGDLDTSSGSWQGNFEVGLAVKLWSGE